MNDTNSDPDTADDDRRSADTRAALILAARALFAEYGYDGASVRAITTRASANLGAITYHFGSKEDLYNEMVATLMHPIRDRILAVATESGAPLDRLDSVVDSYFHHFADHPDLPRFLMERIASGQLPPPPVVETMTAVLRAVSDIVAEGQADGSIRAGDAALMTLSLIAQPVYLTLVQPAFRVVTGSGFTQAALLEHARQFVRAGLAASPSPESP